MSEPIPESIPTSSDPRSKRPVKRRALTPSSQHANQVDALFANPDKEIIVPANKSKPSLPPPPEIVPNVQGSSAGAGSGEFHVYKASRRREYERLRAMDEEVRGEKEREDFEKEREERRKKDEAKTSKNKAKRDKAKERKKNKGKGGNAKEDDKNGTSNKPKGIQLGPRAARENSEGPEEQGATDIGESAQPELGVVIHDDDD